MPKIIQSPVISQDENLKIVLAYDSSDWILTVQNLCGQDLKRVTIVLYPKPPVFVSKEIFKIGTISSDTSSQPCRLSLRINHQALTAAEREIQEIKKPNINISTQFRINLLQTLTAHMNLNELKTLCFHLNIEDDNVPGDTKDRKAAELISLCQRKRIVLDLLETCRHLNPSAPWPELPISKQASSVNDLTKPVQMFNDQVFSMDFKAVYLVSSLKEISQFRSQLQLNLIESIIG